MDWLEAFILGIIQGLTEFLPVSSSGHLEIGKEILKVEATENMMFTVVVHGATVLSTIVVFRKDILQLFKNGITLKNTGERNYILLLLLSMIPVVFIGLLFKDDIESFFGRNLILVGSMLLITALLLSFTYFSKKQDKNVNPLSAIIIGIAQAIAVMPGISRSGATISTALLLKVNKEKAAKFSFLMVLLPIIGANVKSIMDGELSNAGSIDTLSLIIGFVAAFISGLLACSWMIKIVKKGKLIYFAIYCAIIGSIAIIYSLTI